MKISKKREKKFIRKFRKYKIVHLVVIAILDVCFFLSFFMFSDDSIAALENSTMRSTLLLFLLLLIINIFFIFYDFFHLRLFSLEAEKLTREAYMDELTGLPSRNGLDLILERYDTPESVENVGCVAFTIMNLYSANDHLGKYAGDFLLQKFSTVLDDVGSKFGRLGRNGGNEFIAILDNCTEKKMNDFLDSINQELRYYNMSHADKTITISTGYCLNHDAKLKTIRELIIRALAQESKNRKELTAKEEA